MLFRAVMSLASSTPELKARARSSWTSWPWAGRPPPSSRIENCVGFPTGISGGDLCARGEIQALKFGTRFAVPRRVTGVGKGSLSLPSRWAMASGCAHGPSWWRPGVQYRRLPLARPEEFEGSAVFHAATGLEARHTQGRDAVVIGGGNSADQAAMFLSRRAARVHLVVRGASLAASMSDYLVERIGRNEAITLHFGAEVTALHDNDTLRAVTLRQNGIDHHLEAAGLFAMVGAARDTRRLSGPVILDDKGLVVTDGGHATSCPGIFAVGDVRAGSVKRVASAVGEGPVVISKVWEHVGDGQE